MTKWLKNPLFLDADSYGQDMDRIYKQMLANYDTAEGANSEEMNQSTSTNKKQLKPNDLCSCGSGLKYKKCCGKKEIRIDMNILVSGVAGFIGFHTARRLLESGETIIGVDNINDYYDIDLKKARLKLLEQYSNFKFHKIDLTERHKLDAIFNSYKISRIIHLAAQAGVRYSIKNPYAYIDSNITGFINILEKSRQHSVQHFVYASSSSVYGANEEMPFSTHKSVNHPLSLYPQQPRNPTNCLLIHTHICTTYQQPD